MIVLSFIPGLPVAMLEQCILIYTAEYRQNPPASEVNTIPDTKLNLVNTLSRLRENNAIVKVIYPMEDIDAQQVIKIINHACDTNNQHISITVGSMQAAELAFLYLFHRVAKIDWHGLGNIFADCTAQAKSWNANYVTYRDMAPWELRECFSMCYGFIAQEWIEAGLTTNGLNLDLLDILLYPRAAIDKIVSHCGLTLEDCPQLDIDLTQWQSQQSFEIKELSLVDSIVASIINNSPMRWDGSQLSIIGEAIIQNRLCRSGLSLKCSGLNKFPTDSLELAALTYVESQQ